MSWTCRLAVRSIAKVYNPHGSLTLFYKGVPQGSILGPSFLHLILTRGEQYGRMAVKLAVPACLLAVRGIWRKLVRTRWLRTASDGRRRCCRRVLCRSQLGGGERGGLASVNERTLVKVGLLILLGKGFHSYLSRFRIL